MPQETQRYIGDGVYAVDNCDGSVTFWTERESGRHWMTLGANEWESLKKFVDEVVFKVPISQQAGQVLDETLSELRKDETYYAQQTQEFSERLDRTRKLIIEVLEARTNDKATPKG